MEKTLKDLFVPYNIAFKAYKYGFQELCIDFYCRFANGGYFLANILNPHKEIFRNDPNYVCEAPIYQQLFDWLEMRGYLIRKDHSATKYEVIDIDAGIILKSVSIEELNDLLAEVIEYTPRKEYITKYQTP